ncbi:microtubule-associated protein futsch-like isoform X2 [Anopheles darlingi]|uniref:microtubule-associated protein futsch-like isoform X2 n=1 Tax=Anopheles darlingi TaxID=43151 RepID=UPI0021006644|nr:microtubule-associated protein futsch-like isoform X2 [Anopheles darlingi]
MEPAAATSAAAPAAPTQQEEGGELPEPADEAIVSTSDHPDGKQSTDEPDTVQSSGKETEAEELPPAVPSGRVTPEKLNVAAQQQEDCAELEETVEIESSPEKSYTDLKDATGVQSPEEEIFSIDEDDDNEHPQREDDDDYLEMDEDEDEDIYVETTDRIGSHESMDNESEKQELSTDEYTDEDEIVSTEKTPTRRGEKRKLSRGSDREEDEEQEHDEDEDEAEEEEDDDDVVQVLTDDDEDDDEEPDEDEPEEEDDGVDAVAVSPESKLVRFRANSDSSDSLAAESKPRIKVKYRSYKQRFTATARKRALKILNKRRMHVMEERSNRFLMCPDEAIFIAKPAIGLPKVSKPEACEQPSILTGKSTTVSETKEATETTVDSEATPGIPSPVVGRKEDDKSSNTTTISSTTTPEGDKMPTATAMEQVPERIADSSDDALSALSSKKSVIAATTPTVNSSASTEPSPAADAQPKVATDEAVKVIDEKESNQQVITESKAIESTVPTVESSPEGTDGIKLTKNYPEEHKEEEEQQQQLEESKQDSSKSPLSSTDKQASGSDDTYSEKSEDRSEVSEENESEESAIDLSSSSDDSTPRKEKRSGTDSSSSAPSREQQSKEIVAKCTLDAVNMGSGEEASKENDDGVVTSTPLASSDKIRQKRAERAEQAMEEEELQVKNEVDQTTAVSGSEPDVQNLSKAKPLARSSTVGEVTKETASAMELDPPSTSRKRRRSVDEGGSESATTNVPSATITDEPMEPAKKLKVDIESNYQRHERVVNEYIESTQNTSVDEIQSHTDLLVKEIAQLNEMIRDTETKWNNLLHLKKVKEEILLRLNRRKHVIGITDTPLGDSSVYNHVDSSNFTNHHQKHHSGQRSSSVGPRPPTPPPEVEIRPASVTLTSSSSNYINGDTSGHYSNPMISNRGGSSSSSNSKRYANAKDTNSFISQFNNSNNSVTMVPLHVPSASTNMMLNSRTNNKNDRSSTGGEQHGRQSKPVLSNHQQILNNLAISAGLTASGSNSTSLQNGHHNPSSAAQQQQLQIGRQGMRKDVSSIIADYRQKHPENVPRRGRRLKNIGSGSNINNGSSAGNGGSNLGSFGDGGAISLTALSGGKSRPSSVDNIAHRLTELLAAAEHSPQNLQNHLPNHHLHHQQKQSGSKGGSLPEVTLHPVMNSTAHSELLGSHNNSLAGTATNLSAVNSSTTNSLLHGILTKSTSRPASAGGVSAATVANINTFSPTLARLLTAPERMGGSQQSATVTSGALVNLPANSFVSGLNLSKNNSEISITPVMGPSLQQTLLAQQQQQMQEQHKQLQRLRDHHLFKGEPYLNIDDEADDSVDRLVIDEGGDDTGLRDAKRRGAEINENDVPQCQGCKKNEAQFVCAGCKNQWYCSRECQVNAWDDHSEVCL